MPWVDTDDDIWVNIDEQPHIDQFGSSHTASRTNRSWSSSSEPLSAPPGGMITNEVICKYCRQRFAHPIGHGVDYFIDPRDILGLIVCRVCYNYRKGYEEGSIPNPNPPKDIVSIYHNRRKLRTRRRK